MSLNAESIVLEEEMLSARVTLLYLISHVVSSRQKDTGRPMVMEAAEETSSMAEKGASYLVECYKIRDAFSACKLLHRLAGGHTQEH
jgi:hypothetical protein